MKKQIIFCDTNIIFGILKRIVLELPVFHSALITLAQQHDIRVSEFVINEAIKVLKIKYNIEVTHTHIQSFKQKTLFHIIQSQPTLQASFAHYVHDLMDAPILQDACAVHANYLITHNTKDFDTEMIMKDFAIQVTNTIPPEFFS